MNDSDSNLYLTIWQSFLNLSGWEVLATLLGIAYVVLATRESIWCWPAAFVSTLIYTFLFWEGQLPMQALLNAYYLLMAVYGWTLWRKHPNHKNDLTITTRPVHFHLTFIATGSLLTLLTAYYLENVIESRLPYLDAAVTVFSVMNTVLMARKILENWLYWLVIDAAAIALYWQTGYYVTITMFAVYLVLAVIGYLNWKRHYLGLHTPIQPA
ncbi:MAG: nicotinamide riboside transporter PnuC [Thiomicrorhabdus chilensis]|uniref:nicotinamide riboside transporter PnuC n=1 Tax=Thiomicrorhabdus chilensis TaxID=63656 RepID=UPI00299D070C|nr:nicotinamide riboside transporter PnuC [Thiomicrorhabdus chilensis]MDX1346770.1 nicotinamide riboside transporter PnuC [Thiomicrorhabdus chilensis]